MHLQSCPALGDVMSRNECKSGLASQEGGGDIPSYGLNGDVRPDQVWFSAFFVLNGVSISSLFVLTGYPYIDTGKAYT